MLDVFDMFFRDNKIMNRGFRVQIFDNNHILPFGRIDAGSWPAIILQKMHDSFIEDP